MKKPQQQSGDQVWKLFRLSNVEYLRHHPFAVVATAVSPCQLLWHLIPVDPWSRDLDASRDYHIFEAVLANTLLLCHHLFQLTRQALISFLIVVTPIA